jgi:hypothetical protein
MHDSIPWGIHLCRHQFKALVATTTLRRQAASVAARPPSKANIIPLTTTSSAPPATRPTSNPIPHPKPPQPSSPAPHPGPKARHIPAQPETGVPGELARWGGEGLGHARHKTPGLKARHINPRARRLPPNHLCRPIHAHRAWVGPNLPPHISCMLVTPTGESS